MTNNFPDEKHTAAAADDAEHAGRSSLRKQLDYLIKVFAKDYFAVLTADFANDRVEISRISEPVVPLLSQTLSKSNTYMDFLDFYCRQYVSEHEREDLRARLSPDEIRRRLLGSGTYSVSTHHLYQGRNCPTEITLIDVSSAHDGSECVIAARFIEDIVRQQTALKKQDDMVKTLVHDYNAIYHIDLDADTFMILQANNVVNEELYNYAYRNMPYQAAMKRFIVGMVREEDREAMLRLSTCDYIKERLAREDGYSYRYQVTPMRGMQYFEMRIVGAKTDIKGHYAIMTVRNVDATAREELRVQRQIEQANRELALALETAEHANESKSNFISNVSHDMRTPLNAVLGYASLALETDSPEIRTDYLKKIGEAGRTLLSLINDTLDLQKIENGVTTLHMAPIRCSDVISGVLTTITPLMDAKKIHFVVDDSRTLPVFVSADAMRLEEILINLLSNAAKFTPEGGEVLLQASCENISENSICCRLVVKDNGIGISQDFLPRIYEPFTQERTEKSAGIGGSGLGLSIVKRLVDLMRGSIEVKSELGKGTEFIVNLTFPKAVSRSESERHAEKSRCILKGKTILLCEDNGMNREIATAILEKNGMSVIQAVNGEDGVEKFTRSGSGGIDAVLMDIRMPVMDGYEAARRIRRSGHPDAASIPVIAMTADAFEESFRAAKAAGMDEYLTKPVDPEKLCNTLEQKFKKQ